MGYQSFNFFFNFIFDRKKNLQNSYIFHNRHFQLLLAMSCLLYFQIEVENANQKLKTEISKENKKLRALRDL